LWVTGSRPTEYAKTPAAVSALTTRREGQHNVPHRPIRRAAFLAPPDHPAQKATSGGIIKDKEDN